MKYVISWRERPAASAKDYEAAHERVLEIFKDWKMPASFSVLQFVVRIGDYGGYMIVETDKPTDIHYVTSFFAVFEFKVEPVVDVMDAVAVEVQAIEYRKKNFSEKWPVALNSLLRTRRVGASVFPLDQPGVGLVIIATTNV